MNQVQAVRLNILSGNASRRTLSPLSSSGSSSKERWEQCLVNLQEELPAQTIQTWFSPIIPISFINDVLILKLPSRFFYEWIDSHYGHIFRKSIAKAFGQDTRTEFVIANDAPDHTPQENAPAPVVEEEAEETPVAPPALKIQSVRPPCDFNHRFLFANFYGSGDNRFAIKAAEHVARHPGTADYNPLIVQGEVGSGKTHLIHAFGNYLQERSPDNQVVFFRCEQFLHEYVNALQGNRINKFIATIMPARVFLLDDIQFLANKNKSQEGLLFIISELIKRGAQIVISSNVAPNMLSQFNPKLIAFMQQGLVVDLPKSDYTIREKIIRHHLDKNNIRLDESIIHFLSEQFTHNIHHLHSVVVRIVAQISILGKSLTLNEVKYIISQMCPQENIGAATKFYRKETGIEEIVNATANYFNIPVDILQGVSRKQKVIQARQIAIYLCRELTNESLNAIGYHFSNLHHASVLYAYNKISQSKDTVLKTRATIEKIKAML